MKDKREFDMLENADDKEVELLAEVPVLTDREKERILKKSKRKLEFLSDDKARERIIKTGDRILERYNKIAANNNDDVSGIEQYKRPHRQKFASIAACAVLVAGVGGTALHMYRSSQVTDIGSEAEVSQDITDTDSYDAAAIAEELFDRMNELSLICAGGGVETDDLTMTFSDFTENSREAVYHIVKDERFNTVDEAKDYFRQYTAEPFFTTEYGTKFAGDDCPEMFMERTEQSELWFLETDNAEDTAQVITPIKDENGVLPIEVQQLGSEKLNYAYEKGFSFTTSAYINGIENSVSGVIVLDDGKWKMSEFSAEASAEETTAEDMTEENTTDADEPDLSQDPYIIAKGFDNYIGIALEGDVETDMNDTVSFPISDTVTKDYYQVTDSRFRNIDDVKKYLQSFVTEAFYERNNYIWEGDAPLFREVDGKLYYSLTKQPDVFNVSGTCGSELNGDTLIVRVVNKTELFEEDVELYCLKENNKWKVSRTDSVELNID